MSQDFISEILSKMKFKKRMIGGVDEADVWKKIEELQKAYERNYEIQRRKYEEAIAYIKKEHDQDEEDWKTNK